METAKISDESVVELIWHFKVEDGLTWKFCAGIVEMNLKIKISAEETKKRFISYFKTRSGVEILKPCPSCNDGKLVPRKSKYGYFIACNGYPLCKHKFALDRNKK
jgi:hypothetical protein